MKADLKLLRNFAVQIFKASFTISSYRSSAVFCIALRVVVHLKVTENQSLSQFYYAKLC